MAGRWRCAASVLFPERVSCGRAAGGSKGKRYRGILLPVDTIDLGKIQSKVQKQKDISLPFHLVLRSVSKYEAGTWDSV